MKIRVVKAYRDKDTLIVHELGDIVEYPLERGSYIISLGYGEEVKEDQEESEEIEAVKEEPEEKVEEEKVEEKVETPKKKTTKSRGAVK